MKFALSFFIALFLFASCTKQKNWNQYLGPNRNAIYGGAAITISWPEDGPEKLWELELGPGYGGASIFNNEVFILDRIEGQADILKCVDLTTGEEKWNFEYKAEGKIPYPGSRAVPIVDKNYIWNVGPLGDFYCISKKTQEPVWHHNLKEEFDAELPNWGFSQSPLIYNDLVIVAPQGKKAGVAAFNKKTGNLIWKSRALTGYNFHVSPILGNFGDVDQVIMISPYNRNDSTQTHEVVSFNAATGEELWKYEGLKSFATITPATVISETRLFLTDCSYDGNYNPVSILLEITKNKNKFVVNELFKTEEAGCKMHPAVFFENHFYLNNTGRPNQMTCLNMEGEVVWEKEAAANFELGSLIMVNELIINQNGKNGDIYLIDPSPAGYKELGKASFFESSKSQAWAPLAFSNGKLIIRDMEKMVCVNLEKEQIEIR